MDTVHVKILPLWREMTREGKTAFSLLSDLPYPPAGLVGQRKEAGGGSSCMFRRCWLPVKAAHRLVRVNVDWWDSG